MSKTHTTLRVTCGDYDRIKSHVVRINATRKYGRCAQPDVITMLLDSYEEKINQTNDKSSNCVEKVVPTSGE